MAHDNTLWTTAELRRLGKTARQIAAAVKDGTIRPVIRGVYCTDVVTDRITLRALSGQRRDPIVYTGATAAFVYGMVEMSWPARGLVARDAARRSGHRLELSAGVPGRVRTIDGLSVTSPLETAVVLLAEGWDAAPLRDFLTAQYDGVKGNDALAEDLTALPPRHRGAAARLLDGLVTGTASKLELRAVHHLLRALDGVDVTVKINHKVEGYRFDIVIEEADVLVEIDSYAFHGAGGEKMSEETFQTDRWKGNTAVRAGWTLLRYSDSCVNFLGPTVAEQIADTVRYNLRHRRSRRRRRLGEFLTSDLPAWLWHPLLRRFV
ncbi:MAG: hypothetical protein L0K27_11640 [Corynebacterium nuruki]|nr:hypothetical protein [Corynebacterium nuruki]